MCGSHKEHIVFFLMMKMILGFLYATRKDDNNITMIIMSKVRFVGCLLYLIWSVCEATDSSVLLMSGSMCTSAALMISEFNNKTSLFHTQRHKSSFHKVKRERYIFFYCMNMYLNVNASCNHVDRFACISTTVLS